MNSFDKEIVNALKKNKKRLRLVLNKSDGGLGEQLVFGDYIAKGFIVKRVPKGQDFIVLETNDLMEETGRKLYVEVNTGKSQLSRLQKLRKKEKGKDFIVIRPF